MNTFWILAATYFCASGSECDNKYKVYTSSESAIEAAKYNWGSDYIFSLYSVQLSTGNLERKFTTKYYEAKTEIIDIKP